MSEAKNNAKMAGPASTADDSRKLSEDARGLGPWQAGRFTIGVVDTIVGEGGLEIPGYKATKYEILHLARVKFSIWISTFSYMAPRGRLSGASGNTPNGV